MEIVVQRCDGFPDGSMLSVRAGGVTRRQAPVTPGKPLKFPAEAVRGVNRDLATCDVVVDLLAVVGRGKMQLNPETRKYGLEISSTFHDRKASCELEVAWSKEDTIAPAQPSDAKTPESSSRTQKSAHRHSHAIAAQKYMSEHQLLEAMHTILQATVRERPEDPLLHMSQKLKQMSYDRQHHGSKDCFPRKKSKGKTEAATAPVTADSRNPSKPDGNIATPPCKPPHEDLSRLPSPPNSQPMEEPSPGANKSHRQEKTPDGANRQGPGSLRIAGTTDFEEVGHGRDAELDAATAGLQKIALGPPGPRMPCGTEDFQEVGDEPDASMEMAQSALRMLAQEAQGPTLNVGMPPNDARWRCESIATTADQGLFDENDFGTSAAIEDLAASSFQQVRCNAARQYFVTATKEQAIAKLVDKLKNNELDSLVKDHFSKNV